MADLNGDGKPDLAVVNLLSDSVSALLSSTAPGQPLHVRSHKDFATGGQPVSVTAGDVNGDGKLDLAVTNSISKTVSVLLNTTVSGATKPSFSAEEFATGDDPQSVSLSDVNSDGKRDLVVANFGANSVSVLINTTAAGSVNASFAANQEFATGAGPVFVAVRSEWGWQG